MRSIIILIMTAVAAGLVLLGAAYFYPLGVQVGGVNELTFVRTGGFIGINEKLVIKDNVSTEYTSNRFGNTSLIIDKAEIADLRNKTGFFTADRIYSPIPGAADYFNYRLTVQTGFTVKTIQWVDSGVSNETIPTQLQQIQLILENIVQRARNNTAPPSGLETNQVTMAKNFLVQAPTFKFDGITGTIKIVSALTLETYPEQHVITIAFDSRYAGYGNREGQMLAQVITPHTARITVVNDTVVSATLDQQWDELNQKPLKQTTVIEPEQARDLAMNYIKQNHPDTAKYITGNITWSGNSTTHGLVGHETYTYTGGNWNITIDWNVVAPEYLTYKIKAQYTSGITWTGEIHETEITETSYKAD